ncbi:hypothetical protein XM38_028300 [Halomicronema hongdechloris C2206]|uniref:Rieske domain-containing protein n=1 Tax=Halomicronema hongdechloris C2206 TaxID=1641165 RepID=A0A1Z3HNM0_9CYAN|nr:Rieske 2Fe-2S domain-containing protein [Halomicronema hongdechloris]ASC71876.1 hypothetical protein XM38_028300 [Halomicronema hongdechloris C2206]
MVTNFVKPDQKATGSNEILNKLREGHYFVLDNFTNKNILHEAVKKVILDGIEKFEGIKCRRLVEKNGLCKMHYYFPADKLADLDLHVKGSKRIKEIMLKLAFSVGKENLKISGEFFIEENPFAFKISYPHRVAINSTVTNEDYHVKYMELRNKIALEENRKWELRQKVEKFQGIGRLIEKVKTEVKTAFLKSIRFNRKQAFKQTYKGFARIAKQPYAAKIHQPHIDSWYGAPLDGISLWWAIEGAKENNGVVLYPNMLGEDIDFSVESETSYLPFGITVTKPEKIEVPDGSVLLFTYDMLHSSHLNISDFTRIAVIAQIYPKLQFNPDSLHERGTGFYSSEDISKGDWGNLIKVPMKDNLGVLHEGRRNPHVEKRISITVNSNFSEGKPIALCDSDTLGVGEKMLVSLRQERVVIIRNSKGLWAVNAICPHMGLNLIDGFHDENHIYCPGHAVTYCLMDGSSEGDLLKLKVYKTYDDNGKIFLQKVVN